MWYNSNEYRNCNKGFEQQEINNNQYLCCYPVGWSCDGYKGNLERKEENYSSQGYNQQHYEKDFCGCNRHENETRHECCCEKEKYFNCQREHKESCSCREERKECRTRRNCFCNLFNCFGRR